jgi:hypothetical protein
MRGVISAIAGFIVRKHEAFYAAIGRFVIFWSHLEICLDLLVLELAAASTETPKKVPHQLADKIKFIRRKINALPALKVFKPTIEPLLDEIDTVSDTRHDYVHSATIADLPKRTGMDYFSRPRN